MDAHSYGLTSIVLFPSITVPQQFNALFASLKEYIRCPVLRICRTFFFPWTLSGIWFWILFLIWRI